MTANNLDGADTTARDGAGDGTARRDDGARDGWTATGDDDADTTDTYYEVDTQSLSFFLGTRAVVKLMTDGDLRSTDDGTDMIRRGRFTTTGWTRLVNHDLVGLRVTI